MTRARTSIVPAAPTPRSWNRRLETGLRSPITGRPLFITWRVVAMIAAALLATVLIDHPDVNQVSVALLIVAAIQPLLTKIRPRTHIIEIQSLADLVLIGVVVNIVPDLWAAGTLWIGTIIVWHALVSPRHLSVLITLASMATLTVCGIAVGFGAARITVIGCGLLAGAFTMYGELVRREIWENESALMDALSAAGAMVHHSDLDKGAVVQIEGDVVGLTGWTASEWCSSDHQRFIHPDDVDTYWVNVDETDANTIIDRVARMRRKDGSWIWIRDVARVSEGARGERTMRGFSLNVSELEEANETIARQLREDPLTGLPNRRALNERLSSLLDEDADFALVLTDLDRFKEVNDTLGHEAGDQLLQTIARRLQRMIGPDDLVARLGGDEYAIVVFGARDREDVAALAQRLSTECARPTTLMGVDVAVTASTGVALRSQSGVNRATMMRHADIAMYDAKRAGEGYRVFDGSLEQTSTLRLSLSATLADAIERDEIVLHFQPQFDIATGKLVGAEGLARWDHPEFGLLSPAAFLDLALVSESSVPFALKMIDHAARMIRRLVDFGQPIPIAANIAMGTLRDGNFAAALLDTLARHGVSPELLVLELTESDPLWPNPIVLSGLQSLVDAGVRLSIDDFGTGHSTLDRLRSIKVHELKIDRSFVAGMVDDELQCQIVRSIVGLAQGLGYDVVAEGVEDQSQLDLLHAMGCTAAQGYLLARPTEPETFLASLTQSPLTATAT